MNHVRPGKTGTHAEAHLCVCVCVDGCFYPINIIKGLTCWRAGKLSPIIIFIHGVLFEWIIWIKSFLQVQKSVTMKVKFNDETQTLPSLSILVSAEL